jgi:cytochrome c
MLWATTGAYSFRSRKPRRRAFVAALVFFLCLPQAMSTGHSADVELGRYLSSECTTCHGAAKSDSAIPIIHGLDEIHFVEVIKAYRAKMLPNPVMQTIAGRLRDEEIAALAAYFATANKP